VATAAKFDVI